MRVDAGRCESDALWASARTSEGLHENLHVLAVFCSGKRGNARGSLSWGRGARARDAQEHKQAVCAPGASCGARGDAARADSRPHRWTGPWPPRRTAWGAPCACGWGEPGGSAPLAEEKKSAGRSRVTDTCLESRAVAPCLASKMRYARFLHHKAAHEGACRTCSQSPPPSTPRRPTLPPHTPSLPQAPSLVKRLSFSVSACQHAVSGHAVKRAALP